MSSPAQSKHIAWKNVEREKLNPLIDREMVVGGKIMLARVLMKKGAHVPLHHHHNEQVTYTLDDAPRSLGARRYGRPRRLRPAARRLAEQDGRLSAPRPLICILLWNTRSGEGVAGRFLFYPTRRERT